MEPLDIEVRRATYRRFAEFGRAPTPAEVAESTGVGEAAVREAWRRLHEGHALVLDAEGAIRMANPFAANPTDFRVRAGGRTWFANCGWDAFGIGSALHVDSEFDTHCPDCGDTIHVRVRRDRPVDASPVFHVLVPAAQWWDDIGFT